MGGQNSRAHLAVNDKWDESTYIGGFRDEKEID